MSVFFRKLRVNDSTGTATIIVTSAPITSKIGTLAGISVGTRSQSNITFGVLSLIDPETNQVMKANHPTIAQLQKNFLIRYFLKVKIGKFLNIYFFFFK